MIFHIDVHTPSPMLVQEPEGGVALQDGLFPKPERAVFGLISLHELANIF
jgi:hypothetical protein